MCSPSVFNINTTSGCYRWRVWVPSLCSGGSDCCQRWVWVPSLSDQLTHVFQYQYRRRVDLSWTWMQQYVIYWPDFGCSKAVLLISSTTRRKVIEVKNFSRSFLSLKSFNRPSWRHLHLSRHHLLGVAWSGSDMTRSNWLRRVPCTQSSMSADMTAVCWNTLYEFNVNLAYREIEVVAGLWFHLMGARVGEATNTCRVIS